MSTNQRTTRHVLVRRITTVAGVVAWVFALAATLRAVPLTREPVKPTSEPSSQPASQPDLIVHDWVVMEFDPSQPRTGTSALYPSTLPPFISSQRGRSPAISLPPADPGNVWNSNETSSKSPAPQPVGMIRFVGRSVASTPFDVLLRLPDGTGVNGHWPRARAESGRMLWKNLSTVAAADRLQSLEKNHWLNDLRADTSAATIRLGNNDEKFLLYDAEIAYRTPLTISGDDTALKLTNTGGYPIHDVLVLRAGDSGARTATVSTLEPTGTRPVKPGPASKPSADAAFMADDEPATKPATRPATTTSPTTVSSTSPTSAPADERIVTVALANEPVPPSAMIANFASALARRGLLKSDNETIVNIVATHVPDPGRLTVVYLLDQSEMDDLLPLEILPAPASNVRVGVVILRNVDPQLPREIDRLITLLGDADYAKRQEASASLKKFGSIAREKLEKAKSNADVEIVFRAEKLLSEIPK